MYNGHMTTTDFDRPTTAHLPLWMRQAQRGLDWGSVLVAALCLLLALPLLLDNTLNISSANENYAFQAADMAEALREGRLYPRWSPHALNGYGAPVPHFYPPAAPYMIALLDTLITGQVYAAMRVIYALAIVMAGGAMYALALRWMGAPAAVLAAVLYAYCPYIALTAPHVLGDLPASVAAALTPMLLWAVSRLITINRFQDFSIAALIFAVLVLTHPPAAAAAAGLALMLTVWVGPGRVPRVIAALILGGLLAAFYWLPALVEAHQVRWLDVSGGVTMPAFSLMVLFAPLRPIDPAEAQLTPQLTLGLSAGVFLVLGMIGAIYGQRQTRFPLVMMASGIAITGAALIYFPTETWLLAPIGLCAALVGAAALNLRTLLPHALYRLALPVLLIAAVVGEAAVLMPRQNAAPLREPSPLAQIQYEQQGFGVAVLPRGARLPSTLSPALGANRFLTVSYSENAAGERDDLLRIPPDTLPLGVQALPIASETHSTRVQISTRAPLMFTTLIAHFEGWQAALNGESIALSHDPQNGLITVRVPAVQNGLLEIGLGTTPPRIIAWTVSAGALLLIALITRRRQLQQTRAPFYDNLQLLSVPETRRLTVTTLAISVMVLIIARPQSPFYVHGTAYSGLAGARMIDARTTGGIEVIGYRLNDRRFRAGDSVALTLYWRTLRFLPANYQVRVSLEDVNRQTTLINTALRYPANYPTRRWGPDGYFTDPYTFTLPPETPPGNYRVTVEVFDCRAQCSDADRVRFFASGGEQSAMRLPDAFTVVR